MLFLAASFSSLYYVVLFLDVFDVSWTTLCSSKRGRSSLHNHHYLCDKAIKTATKAILNV